MKPLVCGACTACCRGDLIPLEAREAPLYASQLVQGRVYLATRPDGACVYLGRSGCTIHGSAPIVCRAFDCRALYLQTPKTQRKIRIQQQPGIRAVYAAGKQRLGV